MNKHDEKVTSPPVIFSHRRRFLRRLWSIPLVAAALQLLSMMTAFSLPRKKAGSFGTIIDIGPLAELPGPAEAPRHHSRGRFWLINNEDGLLALSNTCNHLDCLFGWDPEAELFVCPCHGSHFDRTGRVLSGPAFRALDRYPLRIVRADGTVGAESDTDGNALAMSAFMTQPVSAAAEGEGDNSAVGGPHLLVDTSRKLTAPAVTPTAG